MTWTLHLPIDLPSANRHGGAATNARHAANAAMYRRQRATWALLISRAMLAAGIPPVAVAPCRRAVTITRLWAKGCREWDDDNMSAACKGLRDAMQAARTTTRKGQVRAIPGAWLVVDDSKKWSRWAYEQRKSDDGRAGVLITITDEPRSDP